jgi:hypothetical protein
MFDHALDAQLDDEYRNDGFISSEQLPVHLLSPLARELEALTSAVTLESRMVATRHMFAKAHYLDTVRPVRTRTRIHWITKEKYYTNKVKEKVDGIYLLKKYVAVKKISEKCYKVLVWHDDTQENAL